jgi:hypothetical protein
MASGKHAGGLNRAEVAEHFRLDPIKHITAILTYCIRVGKYCPVSRRLPRHVQPSCVLLQISADSSIVLLWVSGKSFPGNVAGLEE